MATLPDVWPQKKKRFVCLMTVTPGVSTAYWGRKWEKILGATLPTDQRAEGSHTHLKHFPSPGIS